MPEVFNKHHNDVPRNAVYIGRGSIWGNPFVIGVHGNREKVISLYKEMIEKDLNLKKLAKSELKGKNLVCFCKPLKCHGDILLQIANEEE